MDSNHRSLATTDLQSVPFSHSGTYPDYFILIYLIVSNLPLTGFEPVASPLPRECATPAPQRLIATRAFIYLSCFYLSCFAGKYQGSAATLLHSNNTQLFARSPCQQKLIAARAFIYLSCFAGKYQGSAATLLHLNNTQLFARSPC